MYILNFLFFQYYYISYNMIALLYTYNMINIQHDYKICQIFGILCQVLQLDSAFPAWFCQV